ncbi:MAG: FAD binding domain-containing protein [Candidatus Hydrogenedentota bacterium]
MNNFTYAQPSSLKEATELLAKNWGKTEVLAGGTDLITALKQGITDPEVVVSLKNVKGLDGIKMKGGNLTIGATTKLSALASDKDVNKNFPALVTATKNIGSTQMINMGTVGGDLLQRPRCWFYRNGFGLLGTDEGDSLIPDGDNRYHAIFGNSGPAKFVNPSSLAPALIALGASVTLQGAKGSRDIKVADLFTAPKSDSDREYTIKSNEILTSISIPLSGKKNGIYEIRQRVGLDWPMVAAAVAYNEEGGKISNAVVVLGHVAPTPWVASKAAAALNGQSVSDATKKAAGEAAADGASPLSKNGYKVQQVKVAVRRAIAAAAG